MRLGGFVGARTPRNKVANVGNLSVHRGVSEVPVDENWDINIEIIYERTKRQCGTGSGERETYQAMGPPHRLGSGLLDCWTTSAQGQRNGDGVRTTMEKNKRTFRARKPASVERLTSEGASQGASSVDGG